MTHPLPHVVANYLKKELKIFPPSFVKINRDGKVLDQKNIEQNTRIQINNGSYISDCFEALEHYFPFKEDIVSLPNMELKNRHFFDVHIFFEGPIGWLVFLESTAKVAVYRDLLQSYNAMQLEASSKVFDSGHQTSDILLVNRLGYTCFEWIEGSKFRLLGEQAAWSKPVLCYQDLNQDEYDLVKLHPFLDIFMKEAHSLWTGEREQKLLISDLWTETCRNGNEYQFNALATESYGVKLLLLGPADSGSMNYHDLVQKARNKSLDFEQMIRTQNALKHAITFKNKFVSIITHDLKAPISSVVMLLQCMISGVLPKRRDTLTSKGYLKRGLSELEGVLAYNQKIFNWSNLELGCFQLDLDWYSAKEVLCKSGYVYQNRMAKKEITLVYSIHDALLFRVDRVLFSQLLNNLISNAIKFTSRGGKVEIQTTLSRQGLSITIADNGVGMSQRALKDAFSSDFVLSSLGTEGEKGSGLGLSICRKIVDAHGFSIDLVSNFGAGTTVTLQLRPGQYRLGSSEQLSESGKTTFLLS
ncbi:MAG: hypothetical protein CSA81_06475 [Acidobacteria bacterium]|nr:MAG: hypothetical protein CSA81_06475 [Acidobacteriota bacterium]